MHMNVSVDFVERYVVFAFLCCDCTCAWSSAAQLVDSRLRQLSTTPCGICEEKESIELDVKSVIIVANAECCRSL